MTRFHRIGLRSYRGRQLEIFDDGADGWAVAIHARGEPRPTLLRSHVPNGLTVLIEEAKGKVDRHLDDPLVRD